MSDHRDLLRAYLRQDLSVFVQKSFATLEPGAPYRHNWHIDHLCWQLGRVARGELRRLIINVPPRSMKSITVSVGFTAWLLGHDPTKEIMCVSYAEDLARKLAADTKLVMDAPWYREAFPDLAFTSKRPKLTDLVTTQRGRRFAAGMKGAILGRGADVIVIDDPIKPSDALSAAERRRVNEAYDTAVYIRLNDKINGAIVLIMQRLHEDDLVGHVLARDDWEVVSIPATETTAKRYQLRDVELPSLRPLFHDRRAGEVLHPGREPLSVLDLNRRILGSLVYSAQYQQAPTPVEGNIVRRDWIRTYAERPEAFDYKIASWDTASTLSETADFSVGQVWGVRGLDFYLLDSVRGRFEMPDLRRQVVELAGRHCVDQTLIENTETGRALQQDLRRTGVLQALLQKSTIDKEARFLAQSARFEGGQVHVPPPRRALAGRVDGRTPVLPQRPPRRPGRRNQPGAQSSDPARLSGSTPPDANRAPRGRAQTRRQPVPAKTEGLSPVRLGRNDRPLDALALAGAHGRVCPARPSRRLCAWPNRRCGSLDDFRHINRPTFSGPK